MSRIPIALLWLLHGLPAPLLAALGDALGALAYVLVGERRRVALVNLAKCFPDLSPAARARLARTHFRAVARAVIDHAWLWWSPRRRIERLVRVEGLEHLRARLGRPLILFVPHFVGLDAAAVRLSCEGDSVSMYARQKDRWLSEALRRGRTRFGDQRLVSRQEGVRPLLHGIRQGRPLYYLPDQDYGRRHAVFVPFFGVAAATVPGLSRIARLTGAQVMPVVPRMLPRGAGYVVRIDPPWQDFPTDDSLADTRRMNAYIERRILEMPEQYNWMHKRFKTRPPGEAGFYA
ncbi:MAG: lipid A biosynthesis acyltransferase [Burkholderiales bacterium]|nr:lipid A biosynthesis acyltransferase [Burkholderiales bacterium]